MAHERRVAVTGLGIVSPIGLDVATFAEGLFAGRCAIDRLVGVPLERLTVSTRAQIRHHDHDHHLEPRRALQLDRVTQLALLAAREAWRDASPAHDPLRTGCIMAAPIGVETFDDGARSIWLDNARRLPPLTVPRIMPNAPASQISMELTLQGPTFAVASACASATHAIGLAVAMIRGGLADVMVTGGSDAALTVGYLKAWDALRVLSPDVCRPFSKGRPGVVLGEAGAALVLEDWDRATARGATIHAEMLGFGMSADAGDLLAPDRNGAVRAMRGALADAGLAPDRVDHVNAHGTGTRLNDSTESAALRDLLGDRLGRVPVTATKSQVGHSLNASGAVEAIATILALREGIAPPTVGFVEPDPECPVDCVPNEARRVAMEVALSNSFAFGGLNASLCIGRAR